MRGIIMDKIDIVDHEVRIRLLEDVFIKIDKRFDKLDLRFDKIDENVATNFHWVLGIIITLILTVLTLFGRIILHLANLI